MKKVLFTLAAVATLAACTAETVMDYTKEAITFDNTFVDNATRAAYDGSYNTNNLEQFEVYATIKGTGTGEGTANIFNKELVKKGAELGQGVNWSYDAGNTQYWIPENTYKFRAIADGNIENVTSVVANEADQYLASAVNLLDASAQKDVLVAEESVDYVSGAHTVKFTFAHILAKAKFTVKNTIATNNGYSYKVSSLSINGIAKNGVYTFGTGWSAADAPATYDLSFGNAVTNGTTAGAEAANIGYNSQVESNFDRLLIPTVDEKLNITFTYQLLKNGVVIDTQNREVETEPLTLKSGQAYNFVFSLGNPGEPILFDVVKVTEWDMQSPIPVAVVSSPQELKSAVQAGGLVTLAQDIDLTADEMHVAAENNVAIDLDGHTLTVKTLDPIKNNGTMTLKNGKIVSGNAENTRRCVYNYGEMTIDGVEFTQSYAYKGAAINNEGKLTIEDATVNSVYYAIWTSGANAETVINGGTYTATNDLNVRSTWAYAVNALNGAKITVNGGSFTGNHGAIAAGTNATVTLNKGSFNCTATYTGSSDWVLYAETGAVVKYNKEQCTLTTANPAGTIKGNVVEL